MMKIYRLTFGILLLYCMARQPFDVVNIVLAGLGCLSLSIGLSEMFGGCK